MPEGFVRKLSGTWYEKYAYTIEVPTVQVLAVGVVEGEEPDERVQVVLVRETVGDRGCRDRHECQQRQDRNSVERLLHGALLGVQGPARLSRRRGRRPCRRRTSPSVSPRYVGPR